MIDHIVEDAIKRVAKGFSKYESLDFLCPSILERICEDNNWVCKVNEEYNGWELDWWADVIIKKITIHVYGSLYYGYANIEISNG